MASVETFFLQPLNTRYKRLVPGQRLKHKISLQRQRSL